MKDYLNNLLKSLISFTNDTFDVRIKWLAKKVKTLFKVKSLHQVSKIYKGYCSCGESYIGETIRNVQKRQNGLDNPINKSNPSKHIKENLDHVFNWSVLANAPKNMFQRKVPEANYIVLEKPTPNEQLELGGLNLFKSIKSIKSIKRCNVVALQCKCSNPISF